MPIHRAEIGQGENRPVEGTSGSPCGGSESFPSEPRIRRPRLLARTLQGRLQPARLHRRSAKCPQRSETETCGKGNPS